MLSQCYAVNEATQHFFVKDKEHPYIQQKPFAWIRGYHTGGKSLMWARWTQRWIDLDFEANAKQSIGTDWPIRYKDIAPWYSYVERFVGISGLENTGLQAEACNRCRCWTRWWTDAGWRTAGHGQAAAAAVPKRLDSFQTTCPYV